jgi:putative ABC transport system permease protein
MISNLLLVAIRNIKRDIWYNLLNIFGLMIGITFSIFLIFYIKDELRYDKQHVRSERIFRINSYIQEPDKPMMNWAITQFPLGPTLRKDYPEVEEFTRFVPNGRTLYKYGDLKFYEDKIYFADSGIFKIFSHHFIEGNPNTALVAPNSIVLTKSIAEKYFGKAANAIGKSLENDNKQLFRVTAVIDDVPQYSHIRFNLLVSLSTLPADFGNNWGNFSFYTYILLKPNVNPDAFEKKLSVMYEKYMASIFNQFNVKIRYGIQKITDIHLHSDMANEPEELGSMSYIYIFSAVVLFMLLIACINYMNLTTARSARRAKEIGIRKVTGSSKWQLVAQFLVESTLTTIIALLLSIALFILLLPLFNQVSGKQIGYESIFEPGTFFILLCIILFVGLVGGSYPAFYLSNLQPVTVLKGTLSKNSGNVILRRILVVVQFTISMIMLICTWVVDRQLNYLRTKDLGFNKEQVLSLTVNANRDMRGNIMTFKNEVRKNPRVKSVSSAQTTPGGNGLNFNLFTVETNNGSIDQGVDCYAVDENYFNTLGIKLIKGRNFSGLPDTVRSIVVNENMAKYFKWDEPLGKKVKFPGDTTGYYLEVVGVVKDFNQKSLYNPIAPLILFYTPNASNLQVKLDSEHMKETIADIEKKWNSIFPDLAFSYTFLDEDFNAQYAADQRRGKIYAAFSMLTIFITCLGLLGLIAFTTQQRQKEISIRKVLGAGVAQLVPLITKNFVVLVGISCLIAFPVAYIFMNQWLKIFPYNTGMSALPFIFSAIVVLSITMLTVVFHTVKAAVANPAQTLKTE